MQTIRQQIISLIGQNEMSAMELSQALGIREKDVYEHLDHILRSISSEKRKLKILPFQCLHCGYIFSERKRLSRPSRCPSCKKSHIQAARYGIE